MGTRLLFPSPPLGRVRQPSALQLRGAPARSSTEHASFWKLDPRSDPIFVHKRRSTSFPVPRAARIYVRTATAKWKLAGSTDERPDPVPTHSFLTRPVLLTPPLVPHPRASPPPPASGRPPPAPSPLLRLRLPLLSSASGRPPFISSASASGRHAASSASRTRRKLRLQDAPPLGRAASIQVGPPGRAARTRPRSGSWIEKGRQVAPPGPRNLVELCRTLSAPLETQDSLARSRIEGFGRSGPLPNTPLYCMDLCRMPDCLLARGHLRP